MKLIIGTITYNNSTVKYLPEFFDSLKKQIFKDFKVLIADNSEVEENENKKYINNNVTDLNFDFSWNKENIGFGRAHNKMIKMAIELGADYFLVINPDVKLTETALEKMMTALDADTNLGSVSPKILKWNFTNTSNNQLRITNYELIDSCGIGLLRGLRFVDIGQAQEDKGQFDNVEILGPSGACGMYRISSLQQIAEGGKHFDELMFMYKEDCDLAYRLNLAGFKSKCVTEAIAYHDRTVCSIGESNWDIVKNRKNKSKQVRIWSFVNQQIIYWKYWRIISGRDKLVLVWNQIKLLAYIILFEQYLLLHLIEMRMKCRLAKVY